MITLRDLLSRLSTAQGAFALYVSRMESTEIVIVAGLLAKAARCMVLFEAQQVNMTKQHLSDAEVASWELYLGGLSCAALLHLRRAEQLCLKAKHRKKSYTASKHENSDLNAQEG